MPHGVRPPGPASAGVRISTKLQHATHRPPAVPTHSPQVRSPACDDTPAVEYRLTTAAVVREFRVENGIWRSASCSPGREQTPSPSALADWKRTGRWRPHPQPRCRTECRLRPCRDCAHEKLRTPQLRRMNRQSPPPLIAVCRPAPRAMGPCPRSGFMRPGSGEAARTDARQRHGHDSEADRVQKSGRPGEQSGRPRQEEKKR